MKKILSILCLCLVVLFSGCSSDDEDEATNYSEKIVGKWIQKSYLNSGGYFTEQEDGTYIQFRADGTFTFYLGSIFEETTNGTYSMPFESIIELKIEGETTKPSITISDLQNNKAKFRFALLHKGEYEMERQ